MKKIFITTLIMAVFLVSGCVDYDFSIIEILWHSTPVVINNEGTVAVILDDELYLTDPQGSAFEKIVDTEMRVLDPAWSQDGKKLLYVTEEDDLWKLNLYTPQYRETSELLQEMYRIAWPSFSGDPGMIAYMVLPDENMPMGTLNICEQAFSRIYPLVEDAYGDYEWIPSSFQLAVIVVKKNIGENSGVFQGTLLLKDVTQLTENNIFEGYFISKLSSLDVTSDGKKIIFSASENILPAESLENEKDLSIYIYDIYEDTLEPWQGPEGYDFYLPGSVASSLQGIVIAKEKELIEGWMEQLYMIRDDAPIAIPGWPVWLNQSLIATIDLDNGNLFVTDLETKQGVDLNKRFEEIYGADDFEQREGEE